MYIIIFYFCYFQNQTNNNNKKKLPFPAQTMCKLCKEFLFLNIKCTKLLFN